MSTVTRHMAHLETSGLVRLVCAEPDLEYLFRHALVQDAAYQSLLSSDRRRLHQSVGRVIERLYADRLDENAATLARHFAQAGDKSRALDYYSRAASAELNSYANQEAEIHFHDALALAPPARQQAGLLSGLGEALYRQGRFEEAFSAWRQAIEVCQDQGDADGMAALYARSARAAWYAGDTPRGLALCEEGLAAVEGAAESGDQSRLLHEAARAYLFNGMADRAEPLLRQALGMARRQGAVGVEADALATLGILPRISASEVLSALRTSVALAEEHGLLEIACRAHHNLGTMTAGLTGDLRASREEFHEAIRLARKRGVISEEALSWMGAFGMSMALGEIQESEEALAQLGPYIESLPDPESIRLELRAMQTGLHAAKGEWQQAAELQRQVLDEAERRGNLQLVLNATEELAGYALELDALGSASAPRSEDWSEAEAMLRRALDITSSGLGSRVTPNYLLSVLRARQGRLDEARTWLAKAEYYARAFPSAWDDQTLRLARLELATAEQRWDDALALAEAIANFERDRGRRWNWARALREWAEVHARRGEPTDLERAQALMRQARQAYEEMGIDRYATLVGERLETLRTETFARARAHGKIAQELAVAGRIQAGLLPETVPTLPGWQLAAVLEPARETSGDFYDFVRLAGGWLGIVVADVADKGAGAALYMALSRTLIRSCAAEHPRQPAETLKAVNVRILDETDTDMFVTVFYGVLDPETGTLHYCNAGHPPPFLIREAGCQALERTGMALGIIDDAALEQATVQILPANALIIYSDGATDAQGLSGEAFGEERLVAAARASLGRPAGEVQAGILANIRGFVGDAPPFDDLTLMTVIRE